MEFERSFVANDKMRWTLTQNGEEEVLEYRYDSSNDVTAFEVLCSAMKIANHLDWQPKKNGGETSFCFVETGVSGQIFARAQGGFPVILCEFTDCQRFFSFTLEKSKLHLFRSLVEVGDMETLGYFSEPYKKIMSGEKPDSVYKFIRDHIDQCRIHEM